MNCCGSKRTQFRSRALRGAAAEIAPAKAPVAAERVAESRQEREFAPRHQMLDLQAAAGNRAVQSLFRKAVADAAAATRATPASAHPAAEGRPLEPGLRREMEARIGGDLSQVRIHAGEMAGASARQLGALAYTVGNHIHFAPGRFAPETSEGRRLLAHELVHTRQQDRDGRVRLQRQPAPGAVDVDLAPASTEEAERLRAAGVNLPTVGAATWTAIGGSPYATLLPGYSQQGDTCGAASLVTALLIWDREHWDPAQPNSRAVEACELVMAALERHGSQAAEHWAAAHPLAECAGDRQCSLQAWQSMRDTFLANLAAIRATARTPGGRVTEANYRQLGLALYFLWNQNTRPGLDSAAIFNIQRSLGLNTFISTNISSFDAIFSNSVVTGLGPDEMAQVFWITNRGQQHAFLVGRLQSGEWFLSDQGPAPAAEFRAPTLDQLRQAVSFAASSGAYWLYTGSTEEFIRRTGILPGYTGAQKLAGANSTHQAVENTVPPGAELCEIDAGWTTIGETVTRVGYVDRKDSLAAAQAALAPAAGGGLIVEMPAGVFIVYTTSAVSQANLDERGIDASDSAGMLLGGVHSFHHAWLILGNRLGIRRSWFQVY